MYYYFIHIYHIINLYPDKYYSTLLFIVLYCIYLPSSFIKM